MVFVGPISSAFDFLTFFILLNVFHASETLFHTGWFVESLVTQTLVIFIVRTGGNPFRSPPSLPLIAGVCGATIVGVLLPYTPVADRLGFAAVPAGYLLFVVVATSTYLAVVQLVKQRLLASHLR